MRLIDADALIARCGSWYTEEGTEEGFIGTLKNILDLMPTIEPERKVEELLPDGTLHLFTDTDLSKVDRVLVSQNGTHYGNLYYVDDDEPKRKTGKWIPQNLNKPDGMIGTAVYYYPKCSVCGETANYTNFCPNCGAKMDGGEADE